MPPAYDPTIGLCEKLKGPNVTIENGLVVGGTGSILGDSPILQDKAYFEVTIKTEGTFAVGVATKETALGGVLYAARLVDSDDRSTHFQFVPVLLNPNPDDERVLYGNAQVRVQHIPHASTGLPTVWLHDAQVEKEEKSTSTSAAMGNKVNRWIGFSTQVHL